MKYKLILDGVKATLSKAKFDFSKVGQPQCSCGSYKVHTSYFGGLQPIDPQKRTLPWREFTCYDCGNVWDNKR